MLVAEATEQEGRRQPSFLGLPLPPLGREHEIRYMLAVDERNLAELRSIP
jgi:hypothetical protein